jgi:protein phosphatase
MGSHAEGGVASHIALEAMVAALSGGSRLQEAVEGANEAVLAAAAEAPEREGMATTLVAVLREGTHYEIANIGDSRAYRITGGQIQQVTRDHSFVAEAIETGRMSKEEAQQSPWKTAVTRSLGAEPNVEVDVFRGFDAADPAIVVLCTDGVHGVLEGDDIMDLVKRTPDIRDVARTIAEEALLRGGEDNVAAAAVRFGENTDPRAEDG